MVNPVATAPGSDFFYSLIRHICVNLWPNKCESKSYEQTREPSGRCDGA